MSSATVDEDDTPRRPHDDIPDGEQQSRIDRARQEGARSTINRDSPLDDISAAFRKHSLMESREIGAAAHAEVVRVGDPELRRWYVGTFAPRLHDKVGRGLGEAGWDFACPMSREWHLVARPKKGEPKKVAKDRPLFGTYGFLHPQDGTEADFVALDRVHGFGGLVRRRTSRIPLRLPLGEIERFGALEANGVFDATRSRPPKVKPMDRVTVTSGPFQGLKALVEMTMGERVKVLMDMLGVVEMSMEQVEVVC